MRVNKVMETQQMRVRQRVAQWLQKKQEVSFEYERFIINN